MIFEIPDLSPQRLKNINVVNKKLTNLGNVNVCPDGDDDGFNISKDCNDKNPDIFPGAKEVCNEGDDNCDGNLDEGLVPSAQDVSVSILSPENGSSTSPIRRMSIHIGGACTPDFFGLGDEAVIVVVQAPDGFPIKASIFLTKPSGSKEFLVGQDPSNPGELHICTPLCEEPSCCSLASISGSLELIFNEQGEYILQAIVFDVNNSILAQDSIKLVNP